MDYCSGDLKNLFSLTMKKIIFIAFILSSATTFLAYTAPLALADEPGPPPGTPTPPTGAWGKIEEPLINLGQTAGFLEPTGTEPKSPAEIAGGIIKAVLTLLGIIALILIVYSGFLWMTAAGNEERLTKTKKVLTNAIIGLVIIVMAYSITHFVIKALAEAAK